MSVTACFLDVDSGLLLSAWLNCCLSHSAQSVLDGSVVHFAFELMCMRSYDCPRFPYFMFWFRDCVGFNAFTF